MRISACFLAALVFAVSVPAQTASAPHGGSSSKIDASSVWNVPPDFVAKAHAACDKSNPPNYGRCFLDQMKAQGAPDKAVSFSLMLFRQTDGEVGILVGFKPAGPVDMARVLYPLRANDNYGLLLVNGDPPVLNVDDLKKLDTAAMEQTGVYKAVKERFPNATLWPGDRSGADIWPASQAMPGGGQQIIIGYPLLDGCHACRPVGLARFAWEFDAKGNFLKTEYVPTPPPPKLMRPNRMPPGAGQTPQTPQTPQAPPQAQPPAPTTPPQ